MDPPDMSPEEFAQASSGPNRFVFDWVGAAIDDRVDDVWPPMTADFRLAMTQSWISNNPAVLKDPITSGLDRDELARELSAARPQHVLFVHLARVSLRLIKGTLGNRDVDDFLIGTRPRPVSPTLELVRLYLRDDMSSDADGRYFFSEGDTARGSSVLVHRGGDEWQIAGVGDGLLHPGWPPTYEHFIEPED